VLPEFVSRLSATTFLATGATSRARRADSARRLLDFPGGDRIRRGSAAFGPGGGRLDGGGGRIARAGARLSRGWLGISRGDVAISRAASRFCRRRRDSAAGVRAIYGGGRVGAVGMRIAAAGGRFGLAGGRIRAVGLCAWRCQAQSWVQIWSVGVNRVANLAPESP